MLKALEETMDTIYFTIFLMGLLAIFSGYFRDSYQLDGMELIAEAFLDEAERKQSIMKSDYELLENRMEHFMSDFDISISLKCKRKIPQYVGQWTSKGVELSYTGEVKEELVEISYTELIEWLKERNSLVLEAGDCIRVSIQKGEQTYSMIQKIVRR